MRIVSAQPPLNIADVPGHRSGGSGASPLDGEGVSMMTWLAVSHDEGDEVRLDLAGDLTVAVAEPLRKTLVQAVTKNVPRPLVISLAGVSRLDVSMVPVLVSGYLAAVDHGTSYRVVCSHGSVRQVLIATGTLDMLADSDDVGALMAAALSCPPA